MEFRLEDIAGYEAFLPFVSWQPIVKPMSLLRKKPDIAGISSYTWMAAEFLFLTEQAGIHSHNYSKNLIDIGA